jgi:putative endopeptidase
MKRLSRSTFLPPEGAEPMPPRPLARSTSAALALVFTLSLGVGLTHDGRARAAAAQAAPAARSASATHAGAARAASGPAAALDPANFDTTCAPCRDFFQYANGGWLKHTTIPPTYSTWGSFQELTERNRETLHLILEDIARVRPAATDSNGGRLADYWSACMDSAAAEAAGVTPIQPLLAAVDGMHASDLAKEVAWLHAHGVPALFEFRIGQDPKRSDLVIVNVGQGGLGLPDRDYYTRRDSAASATRERYDAHIARSFELLGRPSTSAHAEAQHVMALESNLAGASMTIVQRRDPNAIYHKMPVDSLRALCPAFDWRAYFAARGLGAVDSVNVTQPEFFRALNGWIGTAPIEDWQAYLRWRVVDDAEPLLTQAFAEEAFHFAQALTGVPAMPPRWKRCLTWTDQDLGDALGARFVAKRFPPAARARALAMVHNLEAALGDRITQLEWMGPETRRRALDKLHAFEEKIGVADHPKDYAGVHVSAHALYANRLESRAYDARRAVARFGRPVDRGEWTMTPPTVNAYYSSSLNTINFPAGILEPPFYDPSWDDAMNYGGIGAVIGHEMTHGFDDRGRQFDAAGNLRDWWTADDAARYKVRADRVAAQFDGYTVLDTLHLNGRQTLGENIADLGGAAVAYAALEHALAGKPRTKIGGFTPEQRFFLSWAQVWRAQQRPEALRTQVLTNAHSPAVWRVDGPFSNLPEFAKAFGCRTGDPMVRPDSLRARIW